MEAEQNRPDARQSAARGRAPRYTTFETPFLDFMAARGGWPSQAIMTAAIEARGDSCHRQGISSLTNGRYVRFEVAGAYLGALALWDVSGLKSAECRADMLRARQALADFLRNCNIELGASTPVENIIAHTTAPTLSEVPDHEPGERPTDDWFVHHDFLKDIPVHNMIRHSVMVQPRPDAAKTMTDWAFVHLGALKVPNPATVHRTQLIDLAAQLLQVSPERFADNLDAWRAAVPWSAVMGMKGVTERRRIGYSVILPLDDDTYEQLREGKLHSADICPDDLLYPSTNLLFLVLTVNPDLNARKTSKRTFINPTRPLSISTHVQHGALMRVGTAGMPSRYRIIAPRVHNTNAVRLEHSDYRPTGTREARTGFELWERHLDFDCDTGIQPWQGRRYRSRSWPKRASSSRTCRLTSLSDTPVRC
ncbi:MAG: hypothetical protein AAF628_34030 [Planctomycetota bacterium]